MFQNLNQKRRNSNYPSFLYELILDMFSIVQFWEPPPIPGTERGRIFEKILYRYCDYKKLDLCEKAGSRTLCGEKSSSGFLHESDGVLATPEMTIHFELKHLSTELKKNELLIFNQKGIDFLMSDNDVLRSKPLYRIILSGNLLSLSARLFCLQWGIIAIEPDWLPLLLLHGLANCHINNLRNVDDNTQDEIWQVVPKLLVPVQERISRLAGVFSGKDSLSGSYQLERVINQLQRVCGDEYWIALDNNYHPNWLEENYEKLHWELALYEFWEDKSVG